MGESNIQLLNRHKIGIIGCGHLGQSIAQSLLKHGLEKENLLISSRGSQKTLENLEASGLLQNLTSNQTIFEQAGIVLITIRPQDILELKGMAVPEKTLLASCMAGVPIDLLQSVLGSHAYRMMFSGPDTIAQNNGVASMYPEQDNLKQLLRFMSLKYVKSADEKDLDVFTAGVCMPAALLKTDQIDAQQPLNTLKVEYPLFLELYHWANSVLPNFESDVEKKQYIDKMITKGGITEAIIRSLEKGDSFNAALLSGVKRTQEISKEIQKSILSALS
ncbi:pyrroline-5-carboxylate reductase family protein [Clostridium merdae]|uniref:pyrroline-5-carboxylate reductase family protein n=1 Tax=Clostridium merdae TaxID=1958780 RepID=UPI0013566388|nr:NAD(P)-binding domain-containing protein [Clostridium merdae]